ncbi:MAG TPA: DUF3467 domain-containing protein [Candidatus Paceibacterota bacterium]
MDNKQKDTSKQKSGELHIYMLEHAKLGLYSNIANVSFTKNEVTIIFMQKDISGTTAVSKVILPMSHVESLVDALSKGLEQLKGGKK